MCNKKTEMFERRNEMGFIPGYKKGLNLGGWISQCPVRKEYQDAFITEKDFETLREIGVDHIRLPYDYNLFETEDGEDLDYGWGYMDNAVAWARKYGINVLIDMHRAYGYRFQDYKTSFAFFEDAVIQERFFKLWDKVSARYGKEKNVAFGLLNEIVSKDVTESWNNIAKKAIKRIRANAPDAFIMVGGVCYNAVHTVKDIFIPDDPKVVYEFHFYEPFVFTHQGAPWDDKMDNGFRTVYPLSGPEYAKALGPDGHPDYKRGLNAMPAGARGREMLEPAIAEAAGIAKERGVLLYCGEYGVFHNAKDGDLIRWYKDMNAIFTKHEISRAAWNYKSMGFGVVDERRKSVFNELCGLL